LGYSPLGEAHAQHQGLTNPGLSEALSNASCPLRNIARWLPANVFRLGIAEKASVQDWVCGFAFSLPVYRYRHEDVSVEKTGS
jgi:hypothetical protein